MTVAAKSNVSGEAVIVKVCQQNVFKIRIQLDLEVSNAAVLNHFRHSACNEKFWKFFPTRKKNFLRLKIVYRKNGILFLDGTLDYFNVLFVLIRTNIIKTVTVLN